MEAIVSCSSPLRFHMVAARRSWVIEGMDPRRSTIRWLRGQREACVQRKAQSNAGREGALLGCSSQASHPIGSVHDCPHFRNVQQSKVSIPLQDHLPHMAVAVRAQATPRLHRFAGCWHDADRLTLPVLLEAVAVRGAELVGRSELAWQPLPLQHMSPQHDAKTCTTLRRRPVQAQRAGSLAHRTAIQTRILTKWRRQPL